MAKRYIDPQVLNQSWFLRLSSNAKLIYHTFNALADIGGFVPYSPALIQHHTGLKHEHIESAINELEQLYIRVEGLVWIIDYPIQQSNFPFKSNTAHLGCWRSITSNYIQFNCPHEMHKFVHGLTGEKFKEEVNAWFVNNEKKLNQMRPDLKSNELDNELPF